jgi:hypothetical protein
LGVATLLVQVAAAVGSFGSLVVLALSWHAGQKLSWGQLALVALAVALGLGVIAWELRGYLAERPWVKNPKKVPAFMKRWITDGGRVAIFSRDLSWVDPEMKSVLIGKAAANNLVLAVPSPIALSEELSRHGADVILYPELDYTIKSRFTIIHLDKADTAVAIGYRLSTGKHRIDRFTATGNDPAFYLALDVMDFLRRYQDVHGR